MTNSASGEVRTTNTLEHAERCVVTPIPRSRRRRFWLAWRLWGIFGAAVSFEGTLSGATASMAAILTSPFWALFALWPALWARDRIRARSLWAAEVMLLLAPARTGADFAGAGNGKDEGEKREDGEEATAIPIVLGREGGMLVTEDGWRAAFPGLEPDGLGAPVLPAGSLPGVNLPALEAKALVEAFEAFEAVEAVDASGRTGSVDERELEAARAWIGRLGLALRERACRA